MHAHVRTQADGASARKKKKDAKPAWALTQGDMAALEEEEEGDLLSFVEGLDFDGFVNQLDDLELKDTFKVGGPGTGRQAGRQAGRRAGRQAGGLRAGSATLGTGCRFAASIPVLSTWSWKAR